MTHLRRLIELQLGDPALLQRDLTEWVSQDSISHSSATT